MTKATHIQYRAYCPACFKQHAVRDDRLVQHGYTRPEGWHQNNGTCRGTYQKHFGTGDGLVYAMQEVNRVDNYATSEREYAHKLRSGKVKTLTIHPSRFDRNKKPVEITPKDAGWAHHVDTRARECDYRAASADSHVQWVLERINTWQETPAVEVKVEPTVTLTHWSGGYWRRGKACAGSAMGAQKGYATTDKSKVDCPKCLVIMARLAAKSTKGENV